MTKILEQAFAKAKKLSDAEQDALGQILLDEIESDHRSRTENLDQILAPVRADFRKSNMSEEELDVIATSSRKRYQVRKSRKKH
jgi:hypothetical protein